MIGVDFLLVYGVEGLLAPMSVVGAAWARLIARALMAILSLILVLKETEVSLKLQFPLRPEMKRLVQMSANLFLRSVALNIALILSTRQAAGLGKEYVAVHTIAMNTWLFTAFFLDGYGAAGNILGGRLLGEKNYKSLWKLTKRVTSYNIAVATLLILFVLISYHHIGLIFT